MRRTSGFKLECHGIRFRTLNVGSLHERKIEVREELKKRRVDVCCIQKVRWKDQGARFVGTSERRYKLCWSGNDAGLGGVKILVEELSGRVVEVRRKSDRVMTSVLTFHRKVMPICAYGLQSGKRDAKKVLVKSWFLWGISMDIWGNVLRVLKMYTGKKYWEKKCRRKKVAEIL